MNKRILVIEDDPFAQEFYRMLLEKAGFILDISEDGDEIIKRITKDHFDILIIDINLKNTFLENKKIDGMDIFKRIRSIKYIPSIIITAYTKYKNENIDDIADEFILKPITDFNILLKKIEKIIER